MYTTRPISRNANVHKLIKARRLGVTLQSQLLDIKAAAQFLDTQPKTLAEIVANGVLMPRATVAKLAEHLNNLLGAADARALLELSQSQLARLIDSGDLKPISGPHKDEAAINLFLKSDIEALRRQRQSFKQKRLRPIR